MANYFIVGGSSGIGKKLAENLNDAGNRVFATYNKNEVQNFNSQVEYHKLDVTKDDINFEYLPEVIDGLVYCPGSIQLKPFHRIKPAEFTEDFELQVVGAVKTIQAVLPRLKKSDKASVVLFSTVAVQSGFNFHSLVATSKGALEGLIRSLAAELAPAIRVNGIAPSLTDTPLAQHLLNSPEKQENNAQRHPLKRIGTVNDMANAAAFFLSEKSSWITGQILHVDGGISKLKI
jgi:NAD(P)-dependent dehydrogenase (short-subunit alcohol dehydrogenase family)